MTLSEKRFVRIDDNEYEIGTAAHGQAVARRQARMDQQYLESAHGQRMRDSHVKKIRRLADAQDRRIDANGTVFVAEQLVYQTGRVHQRVYEDNRIAQLARVNTAFPPGAEVYAEDFADHVGEAIVASTLADDVPEVEVMTDRQYKGFVFVRTRSSISLDEIWKAAYAKVPLSDARANAAAARLAKKMDLVGRSGHAVNGLTGLFNHPSVGTYTLPRGEWITTATNDEIIKDALDLEEYLRTVNLDTGLQEKGFALVVPSSVYRRLQDPYSASYESGSVLRAILNACHFIRAIVPYMPLNTMTAPEIAVSDAPGALLLPLDGSVEWPMPIEFLALPTQQIGTVYTTHYLSRIGGISFQEPRKALLVENFD